ncbi:MAG: hypothetical protein HY690_11400 [Chloroflexi bacterium]|nr:hypothetical protein [Chloroflexota bacterium]
MVGVLNINTVDSTRDLPSGTISLLDLLANQAAIVIENARLYEELARKERRLELFVDKFLRLQAEQRSRSGSVSEEKLKEVLSGILRQTIREFATELRREPEPVAASAHEKLTERERQVLQLIVEGLINKEIGHRLGLSPNTVKNHIASIIEKLGVADRTQAAVMAIRQGLL